MATFYVTASGPRPDFRLVIAFLWPDDQDVDTDGDSNNPASRTWTCLYIQNRECEQEIVDVESSDDEPLVFKVESELEHLAARLAWFLATEMSGSVARSRSGPFGAPAVLESTLGESFDLGAAVDRAAQSRYRRSTLQEPYP